MGSVSSRPRRPDPACGAVIGTRRATGWSRLCGLLFLVTCSGVVWLGMALPVAGIASPHPSSPASSRNLAKAGATRCRSVQGTGSYRHTRVTVTIERGHITCGTARLVAKKLFSNRTAFHASCEASYCFYYTVRVRGRLWEGGYQTNGWSMRPATCAELTSCDTAVGGEYQDRGRVAAARLLRASSTRHCGTIRGSEGWHAELTAEHIPCREARRILRYWFAGGSGVIAHSPPGKSEWTTLRRYPGWRCDFGAGGGGCFKGQKVAGYLSPMG